MSSMLANFSVASVSSLIARTSASQQGSLLSVSYSELPISIATLAKIDPFLQIRKDNNGSSCAAVADQPVESEARDIQDFTSCRDLCSSIYVDPLSGSCPLAHQIA